MKNQALFSLKDKSKKIKCRLLQFLKFGVLSVKDFYHMSYKLRSTYFRVTHSESFIGNVIFTALF